MKKLLVFFLFMGCIISKANADFIEPPVINAALGAEDDPRSPGYAFMPPRSVSSFADGFSADALAFEFKLDKDYHITDFLAPLATVPGRDPVSGKITKGTWKLELILYGGTTTSPFNSNQQIPAGPILFDEFFDVHGNDLTSHTSFGGYSYSYQGPNDLNLDLNAGNYWAAYYNGNGVAYVKPNLALVVTPEPPTYLLLLFGMLIFGAFKYRKRLIPQA